jgi:hypothetical protein
MVSLLGVVVVVLAVSCDDNRGDRKRWVDGSRHGNWLAVFDGYGVTTSWGKGANEVIALAPEPSTQPAETHAGLVVGTNRIADATITAQTRTIRQLRTPHPQPWEVAWLLWSFTDRHHFYAFVLKPNGWELSKQDPAYPQEQRFLASGESPRLAIGTWHTLEVTQSGPRATVAVDGQLVVDFRDAERPYLSGAVGLYCEDAAVQFRGIGWARSPPR